MYHKFLTLGLILFLPGVLYSLTPTYPDTPVVITELPYTLINTDFGLARILTRDSRGNICVVYPILGGISVSRSTDNGLTWRRFATPGTKIDWEDQLHSPTIAIDQGDSIYVAWQRRYNPELADVYWAKYNGISWTSQQNLSRTSSRGVYQHFLPTLASSPQGRVHVVWDDYSTWAYTHTDTSNGWVWPPEFRMPYPEGHNILGDARGGIHLGYYTDEPPGGASYQYRSPGGTWGPIQDISFPDSLNGSPSITVVPGDTIPHAVWCMAPTQPDSYGQHPYVVYRTKSDTSWGPFAVLVKWGFPNKCWYVWGPPVITADRQSNLYVVWAIQAYDTMHANVTAQNIWMIQKGAGGWGTAFEVTHDTIIPGIYPSKLNGYQNLGYPVTENGVDIVWECSTYDTLTGQHYYLMYKRLPSLLGVEHEKEKVPPGKLELTLSQYPNPTRGAMELTYGIPKEGMVNLTIYNLLGERVRTLVHGPTPAGVYRAKWNGKDERLKEAPSGTYFFQLTVGEKKVIKKGTLIR
jgi:hypothetical protein